MSIHQVSSIGQGHARSKLSVCTLASARLLGLCLCVCVFVFACSPAAQPAPPLPAPTSSAFSSPMDASLAVVPLAAETDASSATDAGAGAAAPPSPLPRSFDPTWMAAATTFGERLDALRIGDDNWSSPRMFYSWTTLAQVDALRAAEAAGKSAGKSPELLVATANTNGPPSPFVTVLATLAGRKSKPYAKVAALMSSDARFTKRRYAWTVSFATVQGLSLRRYGDELLSIRLRDEAWVVEVAPERDPPLVVRDKDNQEIPAEKAAAESDRIGAAYHVRVGKDVPARFREYVMINEKMIERWSLNTPDIDKESEAEQKLLEDIQASLDPKSKSAVPMPKDLKAWSSSSAAGAAPRTLGDQWQGVQAFDNIREQLDRPRLTAKLETLAKRDKKQSALEVFPPRLEVFEVFPPR